MMTDDSIGIDTERGWTMVEAERALRETEPRGHKRRQKLDAAAAAILLRTWLERAASAESAR